MTTAGERQGLQSSELVRKQAGKVARLSRRASPGRCKALELVKQNKHIGGNRCQILYPKVAINHY